MRADLETAREEAEGLGDDAALAEAEAAARSVSETARTQLAEAMQAESRLAETLRIAGDRKTACAGETGQWQERRSGAESRVTEMKSRLAEAEAEQERLSARPDEIAAQRHQLADSLEAAEASRRQAADALAVAEAALAEAEAAQREADAALAESREQQIRAEGAREWAEETRRVVIEQISDKLGCAPDGLAELAEAEDCLLYTSPSPRD